MKKALLFILLLFLFRGIIFRCIISYHPVTESPTTTIDDPSFAHLINKEKPKEEVEEVIRLALHITADHLSFTTARTDSSPHYSFISGKANCVGYAAFFASTCNTILQNNSLDGSWIAKHIRGNISLVGVDLHQFFRNPFFKDHDFNIIENTKTGERFIIDATVYDYAFIYFVRKP